MKEPTIDKNNVIKIKPQIYVCGVYCKTRKEELLYGITGTVSIICGLIGFIGGIMMFSYFYYL
jgi:hypothetical protein